MKRLAFLLVLVVGANALADEITALSSEPVLLFCSQASSGDRSLLACNLEEDRGYPVLEFSNHWAQKILGVYGGAVYVITPENMLEAFDLHEKTLFPVAPISKGYFLDEALLWSYCPGEATQQQKNQIPGATPSKKPLIYCFNLHERSYKRYQLPALAKGERIRESLKGAKGHPLLFISSLPSTVAGHDAWRIFTFAIDGDSLSERSLYCYRDKSQMPLHFFPNFRYSPLTDPILSTSNLPHQYDAMKKRRDEALLWTAALGEHSLALCVDAVQQQNGDKVSASTDELKLFVWNYRDDAIQTVKSSTNLLSEANENEKTTRTKTKLRLQACDAGGYELLRADQQDFKCPSKCQRSSFDIGGAKKLDLGYGYNLRPGDYQGASLNYRDNFLDYTTPSRNPNTPSFFPLFENSGRVFWSAKNHIYNTSLYTGISRGSQRAALIGLSRSNYFLPYTPQKKAGWTSWLAQAPHPPHAHKVSNEEKEQQALIKKYQAAKKTENLLFSKPGVDNRPGNIKTKPVFHAHQENLTKFITKKLSRAQVLDFLVIPNKVVVEIDEPVQVETKLINRSTMDLWVELPSFDTKTLTGQVIGQASMSRASSLFKTKMFINPPLLLKAGKELKNTFSVSFEKEGRYDFALAYTGGDPAIYTGMCRAALVSISVGDPPKTSREIAHKTSQVLIDALLDLPEAGFRVSDKREALIRKLTAEGKIGLQTILENCKTNKVPDEVYQLKNILSDFDFGILYAHFHQLDQSMDDDIRRNYFWAMRDFLRGFKGTATDVRRSTVIEHLRFILNSDFAKLKQATIELCRAREDVAEELSEEIEKLTTDKNPNVACAAQIHRLDLLLRNTTSYSPEIKAMAKQIRESYDTELTEPVFFKLALLYKTHPALREDRDLLKDLDSFLPLYTRTSAYAPAPYVWLRRAAEDPTEARFNHCATLMKKLEKETGKSMGAWLDKPWAEVCDDEALLDQFSVLVTQWADYVSENPVLTTIP